MFAVGTDEVEIIPFGFLDRDTMALAVLPDITFFTSNTV